MFNVILKDTVATLEKRGMDSSIHKESPSCALIVAPRHASDNIQVIVEVENIRTNNLCDAKKHKAVIQTGPPSSKNLVKRKRMEGSNDAVWVDLRGDYRRGEHKDRKKLDKGKASIFLPWRVSYMFPRPKINLNAHHLYLVYISIKYILHDILHILLGLDMIFK